MNRKKVFVSGCFDLLHSGHVAFLENANQFGDVYVCIGSDNTIKEINKTYSVDEMVRTRLSLLEENGWLSKVGEDYFCLKKALRTVKINLCLHKVFRLENTG